MIDVYWTMEEQDLFEFFQNMTENEAQRFFDEFLARREIHIAELTRLFHETGGGNESDLELDPDSLEVLWAWAMHRIDTRDFTPSELAEILRLPEPIRREQLRDRNFSADTLRLIFDIGCYFGEVLRYNIVGLDWALCRTRVKRYCDRNQPVIVGFHTPGFDLGINPRSYVRSAALDVKIGKGSPVALNKMYQHCLEHA